MRAVPRRKMTNALAMADSTVSKSCILVVEHGEEQATVIHSALEAEGFKCVCVSEVAEAEKLCSAPIFIAAVIARIELAGRTGLDFADVLAAKEPPVPFILVSDYSFELLKIMDRFRSHERHYLRPPWTIEDLVSRVRELTGKPSGDHNPRGL